MSGIIQIKPIDVVISGNLYTVHGYENAGKEQLADAVLWRNDLDKEVTNRELRKQLISKLKGRIS